MGRLQVAMREGRYMCYVLRLWQAGSSPGSAWRTSLEDVHSGERLGFRSLGDLCAYLGEQVGNRAADGSAPGEGSGRCCSHSS